MLSAAEYAIFTATFANGSKQTLFCLAKCGGVMLNPLVLKRADLATFYLFIAIVVVTLEISTLFLK